MKYLIIVLICFIGLIRFSNAISLYATEPKELDPAAKAFLEAMHRVDSIRKNTPPDLSVTRPACYSGETTELSMALWPLDSTHSIDSIFVITVFVKYEVDSLGHFTPLKVRVKTVPSHCYEAAMTEDIKRRLRNMENNWLPALIKDKPITTVDSLRAIYHTQRPR